MFEVIQGTKILQLHEFYLVRGRHDHYVQDRTLQPR